MSKLNSILSILLLLFTNSLKKPILSKCEYFNFQTGKVYKKR